MAKKIGVHADAIVVFVVILLVSLGFNIYQRSQYRTLLKQYTDAKWQAQDMKVNWIYAKGLLKTCRQDRDPAGK